MLAEKALHTRNERERIVEDEDNQSEETRRPWVINHLPAIFYRVLMKKSRTRFLVSQRCEEILGYTQEEWSEDPHIWIKILHPDDRDRVLSDFLNRGRSDTPVFCTEYRLVAKNGAAIWFRDEVAVVRSEAGLPLLAEGFMLDITARKDRNPVIAGNISGRAEVKESLLNQNARFDQIVQSLSDGFFVIDREGRILKTNHAASVITGYSGEELVGKNVLDLRIHDNRPDNAVRIESIMRKELDRFEVKCRRKDGGIVQLEVRKNFLDLGGEKLFFSFFSDISEVKEKEAALKQQVEELAFKTRNLEEVNVALRELLKRRDEDKNELEGKVVLNVKELVLPYVEKLKRADLEPELKAYVEVLESNLNNIVSPFTKRLSSALLNLTPTEIRVANLVKDGKSTKEIADLFHLSRRTIDVHRDNIRKKLGIKNKKANLRTHLSYMQ